MNKIFEIDVLGDKRLVKELIEIMEENNYSFNIISQDLDELPNNFGIVTFSTVDINMIGFWKRNAKNPNLLVDIKVSVQGVVTNRYTYDMGKRIFLSSSTLIEDYYDQKNLKEEYDNTDFDIVEVMKMYHSEDFEQREKACNIVLSHLKGFVESIIDNQFPGTKEEYRNDMISVAYLSILNSLTSYDPNCSKITAYFYRPIVREVKQFLASVV